MENARRENLNISLLHEKAAKLTPVVNFINVLCVHFLYKILASKITQPNVTRGKLPKSCQKAAEKLPKKHMYKKAPVKH
jgi:hypothetical protein